jgi:hypothetical protein
MCTGNTVGWVDEDGDGCDWYEANDLPGCPNEGHWYSGDMGVANDNCCYCAGGPVSVITVVILMHYDSLRLTAYIFTYSRPFLVMTAFRIMMKVICIMMKIITVSLTTTNKTPKQLLSGC